MSVLTGASVLITGGTGSLGKALTRELLDREQVARLVIFSRDELKQFHMREQFAEDPRLRWFLGDVRDRERLQRAMHGIDYVIHAAALKQVDTAEYNPFEYVATNVHGSQNVIDASIDTGVRRVVALSTDKASSPINLYGATKLAADRMFIAGNHYAAAHETRFSVVRYGNVSGSRGSIVPKWQELARRGLPLPLTDRRMTRFWITLPQAVRFVLDSFEIMTGGELYVPQIPSLRIADLAAAIAPDSPLEEIGIRPGEKLHEEMIALDDIRRTVRIHDRYVVTPHLSGWGYTPPAAAEPLQRSDAYQSHNNDRFLSIEELRTMLELD